MANAIDDEWEYEYDETETEDFYIPIDLSNVPSAQVPINSERRPGHPTLLKSRLRALNATRGQLPEITNDETSTQESNILGEVQITGLHTPNPLIMYNGQLLSCHWTSTIGTELFFAKPEADDSDLHLPLRLLPSVNLLSLGTAKLVAKVGRLRPRDDLFDDEIETQPAPVSISAEAVDQNGSIASSQAVTGEHLPTKGPQPASTNFLARLNEAKARRGETSRLIISQTPEGSRLVSVPFQAAAQTGDGDMSKTTRDVTMGGT